MFDFSLRALRFLLSVSTYMLLMTDTYRSGSPAPRRGNRRPCAIPRVIERQANPRSAPTSRNLLAVSSAAP